MTSAVKYMITGGGGEFLEGGSMNGRGIIRCIMDNPWLTDGHFKPRYKRQLSEVWSWQVVVIIGTTPPHTPCSIANIIEKPFGQMADWFNRQKYELCGVEGEEQLLVEWLLGHRTILGSDELTLFSPSLHLLDPSTCPPQYVAHWLNKLRLMSYEANVSPF